MTERGISRAHLARLVNTTRAMIYLLLDEESPRPIRRSRLWPDIVRVLEGTDQDNQHDAVPTSAKHDEAATMIDEDTRTILENWSKLTSKERQAVSALVRALTAERKWPTQE